MAFRPESLDLPVARLEATLNEWLSALPTHRRPAVDRWLGDAAALRFHLREGRTAGRKRNRPTIVAVVGGTGTGKSTLVNRLLGVMLTASSYRRTFTSGPVAIVGKTDDLPAPWLGWEHWLARPEELPAKGRDRTLVLVPREMERSSPGSVAGGKASRPVESVSPPPAGRGSVPEASGGSVDTSPAVAALVQSLAADAERSRISADGGAADGGHTPVNGASADGVGSGNGTVTTRWLPASAPPTIIDTPDLDGDTPMHHAQADRVFRWAEAVVFVVTPEKYQMTELPPYYRLAQRYDLPTLFVMNKCEEQAVADDYQQQLSQQGLVGTGRTPGRVFILPRDASGYTPEPGQDLSSLQQAVASIDAIEATDTGVRNRATDVLTRLRDQVIAPLREDRAEIDRLVAALRSMETPPLGVNVNPLTQQLQRRLQQRSVLYLIGPQRVLERVRQAPGIVARIPRVAWDWFRTGEISADILRGSSADRANQVPDFRNVLTDQFALVQSRIDDVVRGSPAAARWIEQSPGGEGSYAAARLNPASAGKIAEDELAELKAWLERRWNASPRDTRTLHKLMSHLPGGKTLTKWSESAPYLLTIALVTHGAVFGHLDLLILGGYSLTTWVFEKLSNEVTGRARAANARLEERFADLASDQIRRICEWLERQAPSAAAIEQLDRQSAEVARLME